MLFFSSNPGSNFTSSSNRLDTGGKLIITYSSHQGHLYTPLHFTNQAPYANIYVLSLIYLPLFWWLETRFFNHNWILHFEMKNFWALYMLTIIYQNIFKIRRLIQIKLCRNTSISGVSEGVRGVRTHPLRILSALFRILSALFCLLFRFKIRTL